MKFSNQILIDNKALIQNIRVIKEIAPNSNVLPMLKANAFGHGTLKVAKAIAKLVDGFAVARYEEAISLLLENFEIPIVLMSGDINITRLKKLIALHCQIVIATKFQFEELINADLSGKTIVWLKFNTGMNRLGLLPEEADQLIFRLLQCKWVEGIILMTHLSNANLLNDPTTIQQCEILLRMKIKYSLPISVANSAAIINYPQYHFDWIRPGIMLYGGSPINGRIASEFGLQATMELNSYLLDIRQHKKGDLIGYGGKWECPEDMLIGIVALGYGDGYPRNIKQNTPVWINGYIFPIVGAVSMDLITVDLRYSVTVAVGDLVQFWGKHLPLDIIANCAQTIPNELLTHISPRLIPHN